MNQDDNSGFRTPLVVLEPYSRAIKIALQALRRHPNIALLEPKTSDEVEWTLANIDHGVIIGTVPDVQNFKEKLELVKPVGSELLSGHIRVLWTTSLRGHKVDRAFKKLNPLGAVFEPASGLMLISLILNELARVGPGFGRALLHGERDGGPTQELFNLKEQEDAFFSLLSEEELNDSKLVSIGQTIPGESYKYSDLRLAKTAIWKKVVSVEPGDHIYAVLPPGLMSAVSPSLQSLKDFWVFRGEAEPQFSESDNQWWCQGNQPYYISSFDELPNLLKKYFEALCATPVPYGKKVLVIDDMERVRGLIADLLVKTGFTQVTEATNLKSAWSMLSIDKEGFGLILCDWDLGSEKGIDLLNRLRSSGFGKNIPVIFMLLEAEQAEAIRECFHSGYPVEYALKPLDRYRLQQKTYSAVIELSQ